MSPTVRVLNKLRRHSGPAGILSRKEYALLEAQAADLFIAQMNLLALAMRVGKAKRAMEAR
jgi:hypothetical protein